MSCEWKQRLANAVASVDELLELLALDRAQLPPLAEAIGQFALRVPREYVARMRPGDPGDPLLRQVLPLAAELDAVCGFSPDPLGEAASVTSGVLAKYRGRALLMVSGACAIHCRYCFRRHFPYDGPMRGGPATDRALAAIAGDRECREVILSGGDPLAVDDRTLAGLAVRLADIAQLNRLRIHTRLPIVIPARVTDEMLHWLTASRLRPVMVVHVNHAQEIDGEVADALCRLRVAGVQLLNQSVLLRGVNDKERALCELSERLFEAGVLPYYLHCLDRVAGAAHFEVEEGVAVKLVTAVRRRLPGYLVPRLVRELPGAAAKLPVVD